MHFFFCAIREGKHSSLQSTSMNINTHFLLFKQVLDGNETCFKINELIDNPIQILPRGDGNKITYDILIA